MGVDYFSCASCNEAHSEYDRIYCENCENNFCSCVMPDELAKTFGCWDDVWLAITVDENDNIIPREEKYSDITEVIKQYCIVDNTMYGLELKHEYCPICKKEKENKLDPEYEEYLRLKRKFEC